MLPRTTSPPSRRIAASVKSGPDSRFQGAELNYFDLFAAGRAECFPEIASEPARLQLQLARFARSGEKRTIVQARALAQLLVLFHGLHLSGRLKSRSTAVSAVGPPGILPGD